jgi:preprotein translocase subunit SecY|tara:strand:+ start:1929 stop:3197 length:1269 start_codon:yes stop_codon:yes gene_type:complete
MLESLADKLPKQKFKNSPTKKILLTLFVLFIFRFCNTIPLSGIDQDALKKSFLQMENRNSIMQIINMYSGGGGATLLSPFSLGIIPFINASILIDLLTALIPSLEKLQSEEGETGKRKLTFYKKVLTVIFSIVQSLFLIFYLKSYFYNVELINFFYVTLELVTGAMLIVWLSNIIDTKGIGNGTSIIIFTNIVVTVISKNLFVGGNDSLFPLEILFLLFLTLLICISQTARINIEVVSARQLAFLENIEKRNLSEKLSTNFQVKDNGLSIRLNQAGIFPIIIASNLLPFLSYAADSMFGSSKQLVNIFYYLLIVGFNYFYTIVFWDPEKISEQLRKASVSIVNVTPGRETISYLENVVRSTSIIGGIFLCFILFLYDSFKQVINSSLLNQINISSLIILVGVAFEIQKTLKALYKNILENIN